MNYEQEIQDMDRVQLGFTPLGSYESYLEEALPDSELSNEIIERFEKSTSCIVNLKIILLSMIHYWRNLIIPILAT